MPPSKFAHVVYKTRRFDEMIDWYKFVLECRSVFENDKLCFLTYDEEHHRVALVNIQAVTGDTTPADERRDATRLTEPGVYHLAYTWPDLPALLAQYTRLKGRGILPFRTIRHGPTVSMYYKDPDGNSLEFQIDLGSPEYGTDFMNSASFAANAVGELFDPDELIANLEAGVPVEQLVLRSDQLPPSEGLRV